MEAGGGQSGAGGKGAWFPKGRGRRERTEAVAGGRRGGACVEWAGRAGWAWLWGEDGGGLSAGPSSQTSREGATGRGGRGVQLEPGARAGFRTFARGSRAPRPRCGSRGSPASAASPPLRPPPCESPLCAELAPSLAAFAFPSRAHSALLVGRRRRPRPPGHGHAQPPARSPSQGELGRGPGRGRQGGVVAMAGPRRPHLGPAGAPTLGRLPRGPPAPGTTGGPVSA